MKTKLEPMEYEPPYLKNDTVARVSPSFNPVPRRREGVGGAGGGS